MDYILPASPNWYCSRIVDCDSRGIVCIGCKNAIYVWNVLLQPPKFISYITAHHERVVGVSLCPVEAGSLGPLWCCSVGEDGKVRIWDFDNKSLLKEHELHKSKPTCVHWSPADQNLIASGDERGTVVLWNVSSGETWNWQPDFSNCHIFCLAFSPKTASLLAVGFKSGNLVIVNVNKKNPHVVQRLRGHEDEIQSIAWRHCPEDLCGPTEDKPLSRKETLVATSSRDKTIRIWNTQTGATLSTLTVPGGFANAKREEMGAKPRVWVALAWPPGSSGEIISSGLHGELVLWNIGQTGKGQMSILNPGSSHKGHNRIVFNIATGGQDFKTLVSVSMDRQIIIWDLQKQSIRMVIPTLGGFVFAIDRSEIQPDRLAIGVGDSVLRVCNFDKSTGSIEVQTFWQGIKAKVTAVSWHPVTEGKLAFGTEDGKVGIYDVHTTRPPLISSTYHKKVVFDICWARACGVVTTECSLYSIGDGVIYQHRPSRLDQPAEDINAIIRRTNNSKQTPSSGHSCMAFSVDSLYFAVGNEDGSIDVFETPHLQHVCRIQVQKKLISCLKWHPLLDKSNLSPSRYWLASSSRDAAIHVFNLQKILNRYMDDDKTSEVVCVTESFCRLEGHTSQVSRLYWSPHEEGLLASASFDWTVQVWDVKQGCPLKNYRGHNGHVLCLLWDETDPDVIFSGSDDYALHGWRISAQTHIAPPTGHQKRKKKARPKNTVNETLVGDLASKAEGYSSTSSLNSCVEDSKPSVSEVPEAGSVTNANKMDGTSDNVDRKELLRLVEQKRLEIVAASQASASSGIKEEENDDAGDSDEGDDNPAHFASLSKDSNSKKDRKKRRAKSLFPKSSAADNRGKQPTQQDCIDFARFKYSGTATNLDLDHSHLGCFVDRRNTYALFQQEELYHLDHENYEQHMTLNVFKGSVKEAIQVAADSGQLNDHLMAIAPLVSSECWRDLCVRYAEQLVKEGLFHKASTYYLAANKVYEAINMLKEKKLFKDAICLARVRLSPFDPTLRDLYATWGNLLARDGNYELAAKCHLAADNPKEAVGCLARRPELSALRAAALVSVAANETEAARVYAQKFVQESILASDWSGAAEIIRASPSFQVLALLLSVHEVLVRQLVSLNLLTETVSGEEWQNNMSSESNSLEEMPEIEVDLKTKDMLCIWKPLLIRNEAFLLHIVRIWHTVWNVDLTVANVVDLYNQLISLHDAKQNQAGEKQMLLEASFNIALCTLKMLLQDFEGSAKWLAAAFDIYRDKDQHRIRQAFCRLLFPQSPLYFRNLAQQMLEFQEASLDENSRSLLLMQKSVIPDSVTSISHCGGDQSSSNEPRDGDTHAFMVNTSKTEFSDVDLLSAIYCFSVLEFLLAKQTAADHTVSNERGQGDSEATINDSDATLDNVNCRYIASLAQRLLWDVDARRRQLQESELHIKDAIASLVARHKMSNFSECVGDSTTCPDTDTRQTEPQPSPSKVRWKVTTHADTDRGCWPFATDAKDIDGTCRPSADCQKDGDYSLPTPDVSKKLLALDVAESPQMSEKSSPATAKNLSEVFADNTEEYSVSKNNRECTSSDTEDGRVEALRVDADIVAETMQDESRVSSDPPLDEIPNGLEGAGDVEFQTDVIPCRYEDIPDEWHSYAVDKKYHLPYVTLLVLQKELCRIRTELSGMPCMEQFPNPLVSARDLLLLIAGYYGQKQLMSDDLDELCNRLCDWGLRFAYTSDWIEIFSNPSKLQND